MAQETVRFRIQRRQTPEDRPYWEAFDVPFTPGMNVISALMHIRKHPRTADGRDTTPVVWESSCLEEVCGICSMLINGKPRQACAAIVERLRRPVTLQPLTKFPVVRDLIVDRSYLFQVLKRHKCWIPVDGTYELGPGPRYDEALQQWQYKLSTCFTCGICLEVCPNIHAKSPFSGAMAINQVVRMNLHPTGRLHAAERNETMMEAGGVNDCGNAMNCVANCPKGIPLTHSIAILKRATLAQGLTRWIKSDPSAPQA